MKRQLAVEDEGDEDAAAASSIRNATEDMKRALGALQTQVRWLWEKASMPDVTHGVLPKRVGCERIGTVWGGARGRSPCDHVGREGDSAGPPCKGSPRLWPSPGALFAGGKGTVASPGSLNHRGL